MLLGFIKMCFVSVKLENEGGMLVIKEKFDL